MAPDVELKLEVPPRGSRKLERMRDGLARRARRQDLVSVYFDTARHKLHKHGLSLRVRHIGNKRIQILKANGQWAAGLARRDEWEKPIERDRPDLRAFRHTPLAPLLGKKLAHALKPVFQTRVRRTIVPLDRGESQVDLTLDRGEVRRGAKSARINEVELELKRGHTADLLHAARDVWEGVPVQFAVRSKADRGYDLVAGRPATAVRAQPILLAPKILAAEAFRAIALACVHQVAANAPAVSAAAPEGVHQMRVGLRRLRATMSVFSGMLGDPQSESIKEGLKWITGELGPARDVDVYIKSITTCIEPLRRRVSDSDLHRLQHELEAWRAEMFERAKQAVGSPRYGRLILDTLGWVVDGDWTSSDDPRVCALRERPVDDFARQELGRRAAKVGKRAKKIAKLAPRKRHRLRIAAKKLRYAAEFFRSLFARRKPRKRLRQYVRRLKSLQDCLGALNDITVHRELARDFVRERARQRQSAFAIGVVSAEEESRTGPLCDGAVAAAAKLAKARPFWI